MNVLNSSIVSIPGIVAFLSFIFLCLWFYKYLQINRHIAIEEHYSILNDSCFHNLPLYRYRAYIYTENRNSLHDNMYKVY